MSLFPKYGSSSLNSKSCTKARSMTLAVTSYPDIQKADHIQWLCPVTERSIDWVNMWTKDQPSRPQHSLHPLSIHPPYHYHMSVPSKKNLQNIAISLLFTWLTFIYHSKLNFFAPPWGLQNLAAIPCWPKDIAHWTPTFVPLHDFLSLSPSPLHQPLDGATSTPTRNPHLPSIWLSESRPFPTSSLW